MDKRELNELMLLVQNGDENAFENLFENLKRGVFSFIYSYVNDYQISQDLVQETFIKVKLKANQYKQETNASAWILQIAKNVSLDYLKTENKTIELNDNIEYKEDKKPDFELHDLLNNCLQDSEKQIILLHIEQGYKNKEIAKILNIPLGTVLWKYNIALKKLKIKLKEVGYE